MIGGLKPYPEYTQTDLPWAGRMPAHWSRRRMKFLFRERVQKGFPNEPMLAATQNKGVVRKEDYGERTVTVTKDFHLLKLVEKGDYVISLRSFEGGIEVAHCRGIISPAYTVLAPRSEARGSYYTRFLKSPDFIRSLTLFVTGIREGQNIDYERLSRAYMPLPPADEQDSIGRYLDHTHGRLEQAIRAKRKVITLLHEQKQAIIHRAVTRGLDSNIQLKFSGISWLGQIPTHWDVLRIKQAAAILRGKFTHRPRNDPSLYGGVYPFIQTGAVARAKKYIAAYKQTLNEKGLAVSKIFPNGTLCLTIAANIGDVAILNFDSCFPDSIVGLIPRKGVDRDYFFYLLRCMKREFLLEAPVNTQGNLNINRIGSMSIPLPKIEEQTSIVRHIENKTISIDSAINRLEREIELLREYRTRLVADVVTGKLDVRFAAQDLPATLEVFEPEKITDSDVCDEMETNQA